MKITEIFVSAGRTFNDPYEQFSNYRPSVTLKATIEDNESEHEAVIKLQKKAESLVEEDKKRLLEIAENKAKLRSDLPF